jgi:S-adenosylmethionine hydrolase
MALLLFTDFGANDLYVGQVEAVLDRLAPGVRVIDLLNAAPAFNVRAAAHLLAALALDQPAGQVVLGVVDPGVGSERGAVVVRADDRWYVGPDNGLFSVIASRAGAVSVWRIAARPAGASASFHGRDVFAPVAARIARGDDWREVGPVIDAPVRIQVAGVSRDADGLVGEVVALDGHFGNLLTNVEAADFAALGWTAGDRVGVRLGTRQLTLPFVRTFAEVPEGTPLLYVDSREHIALAINRGHFAEKYRVSVPSRIVIRRKPDTRGEQR